MGKFFVPKGVVYRNNSADIRLAIVDTETNVTILRSDVVRIVAELWRDHPDPKRIGSWSLNVDDVIVDGAIFHQQDAGWPYKDSGYNFRWELPRGYTTKAPGRYRVLIHVDKVGLKHSTHVAEIEVIAPEHGA